ncbi:SMP-30/gluconolactonase/LRE family protein [Roseixanthobacter pseudopolyaromaticivorans]|uniref:SMP-30/gluconolactonase/LRE family protein n=1 Tax=Xanthobacteraceae TaxID=335928 RepID=UPI00372A6B8B
MNEVTCVLKTRALIGECPRWHPAERKLYWVDIMEPSLNSFDPASGETRKWAMPERIGCFGFRREGGIIAGLQTGIFLIDLGEEVSARRVFEWEADNLNTRFNDGRCDPAGRFWAGTVIESMDKRVGSLFRYDPDGTCTRMVDKLICSNGLAFSPDGRTMYHSDSRQDYVWAWDFDAATGAISNQRIFLAIDIQEGRPDGAAVDAHGYYWICHVGGWHLARYSPDGIIDRVIGLPAQRPTMCAFGGPDLKTLYVTTATYPLAASDLRKQPLAGSLFAIDVDVPGIPEPFFGAA